ncbi:MAG: hypothetical protein ACRDRN_10385 [Sciscionella sp.]
MTSIDEMRQALAAISTQLGNAVTGAAEGAEPYTTLVASIDQIRGFVNAMANSVTDEDEPTTGQAEQPVTALWCAGCIQDARNREAMGEIPLQIHPARTVINGLAVCDADGRHRIVTAVQFAAQQAGGLLLPGQLPPGGLGPLNGHGG